MLLLGVESAKPPHWNGFCNSQNAPQGRPRLPILPGPTENVASRRGYLPDAAGPSWAVEPALRSWRQL
jgi:hypothetical protein